ncbi:hypothetical protein ACLBO4_26755, partial [Klebsiella pneumoniae]
IKNGQQRKPWCFTHGQREHSLDKLVAVWRKAGGGTA